MTFATYPSLSDRVVLITGGASGIGADMVRAFAANGARVALPRHPATRPAKRWRGELGGHGAARAAFLRCDVTDIAALQAAIEQVRDRSAPSRCWSTTPPTTTAIRSHEVTPEYWDRAQDVNLRHHFFAAQAVHPHMKELGFGSIINFSSIAWRFGADDDGAYATAKAAVVGLTFALARAFGPDNIRVNAIEPGAVITERQRQLWYKTQDVGRPDRAAPDDPQGSARRGDRAHGAVPRRRRQPHDHQAVHHRRRRPAMMANRTKGPMLEVGLNPYGLTYHLGLQGSGTPRANPQAGGLEGFIALATGTRRADAGDLRAMADASCPTTRSIGAARAARQSLA